MFLAIPIIAIVKVIFDRIDTLKPWGYLFGDDLPKTTEWHKIKLPSYNYNNVTSTDTIFDNPDQLNTPEPLVPNIENENKINESK